jgi:two-component system chemotaxis response regulator CheY
LFAEKSFVYGTISSAKTSMRVLIADDQRDAGTTLADLVRLCQHEVVGVVASGLEAVTAYSNRRPDIVLMDYWMSKLNGVTACRNILAKDPTARIIFVSGILELGDFPDLATFTVLTKPVGLNRLYDALHALSGSTSTEPSTSEQLVPFADRRETTEADTSAAAVSRSCVNAAPLLLEQPSADVA